MTTGTLPDPKAIPPTSQKPIQSIPSAREIRRWKGLKPVQRHILEYIRRGMGTKGYRKASAKDLAEELGISRRTVQRNIDFLIEKHLLARRSYGKIESGPVAKNSYRVVRQVYKETKDENGNVTIQPGLDFKKAFYIGKSYGKKVYLHPPDETHSEPFEVPTEQPPE